jgi:Family of unknown function (DUF6375)
MKIWNGYGSEHSADLVLIGRFKDEVSAEKAKAVIEEITEYIARSDENFYEAQRYSDGVMELLKRVGWHDVNPTELAQFYSSGSPKLCGKELTIRTDEPDISAFLKLMVDHGARVEVYSAHSYPDPAKEGSR